MSWLLTMNKKRMVSSERRKCGLCRAEVKVDEPVLFLLERVGVEYGEEAQVKLYGNFLGHMNRLAVKREGAGQFC